MIFVLAILFVEICYLLLIAFAIKGWWNLSDTYIEKHDQTFCSVIIAARNEEKNIYQLCTDLLQQHYPTDRYEIIIVNDHSTDKTQEIIEYLSLTNARIKAFNAPENISGKKASLQFALQKAKGDLLLFTDADCRINSNWISTYVSYVHKHPGNLYFGNIIPEIQNNKSIIEKFVTLDFVGILAVQSGLAKIGHAFSCNGANMCITRDFYQQAYDTNNNFTSGDDVFLLHKAKQIDKSKIFFIQDENATIGTTIPNTIKGFINQRCRWASKASGYKDTDSIIVALIVYTTCLLLTICFIGMCLGLPQFPLYFSFLFLSKLVGDYTIFGITAHYFKTKKYLWLVFPFQCIYFIYITAIPIISLIKPIQWKNRKIK